MNNIKMPNNLSNERQEELFVKYHNGDLNAREELIITNLKLVLYIIYKFDCKKELKEDLFSIGAIGLIKAVDNYKLGNKFSAFAIKCITNEILMYLRKNNYNYIDLEDLILHEDSYFNLYHIIEDKSQDIVSNYEEKETIEEINNYINSLPYREGLIIKLYFGFNGRRYTEKEIGNILNISRSYVSKLLLKTLSDLREELNKPIKKI